MPYSPAKAAEIAGVSRSLISKEVKAGKLIGTRNNQRHISIEAKDLEDWMSRRTVRAEPAGSIQHADVPFTASKMSGPPIPRDEARIAALEVEVREVRVQIKQALDDRDAWKAQAELLASRPAPQPSPPDIREVVAPRRGFFSRLFGG